MPLQCCLPKQMAREVPTAVFLESRHGSDQKNLRNSNKIVILRLSQRLKVIFAMHMFGFGPGMFLVCFRREPRQGSAPSLLCCKL